MIIKKYVRTEEEEKDILNAQKEGYGSKFDIGKQRYDLLPPFPLDEVVKVYTYGAQKYGPNNWWRGMNWGQIFAAMVRHTWAWQRGEKLDKESGIHHLAHVAWGCFTLIEYERNEIGKDDRVKEILDLRENIIFNPPIKHTNMITKIKKLLFRTKK